MQLRFVPAPGKGENPPPLVAWPGLKKTGQLYQYVGRKFDPKTRVHRSTGEPVVVDSEKVEYAVIQRMRKACRQGDLLAFDRDTAAFCSAKFVEVEKGSDNEWRPKGVDAVAPPPSAGFQSEMSGSKGKRSAPKGDD